MPNLDPCLKGSGYPLRLFYFSLYVKDHLRFALLPIFLCFSTDASGRSRTSLFLSSKATGGEYRSAKSGKTAFALVCAMLFYR